MQITVPESLQPALCSTYPHRPRVLFILRRRPEASREAFEQALRKWRQGWGDGIGIGAVIARAGVGMVEAQEGISGRFRPGGIEVTPFDGYVSLDLECPAPKVEDFERLFAMSGDCLSSLGSVIDPEGSVALAGVANLVIPGGGPMAMILVLDRPASLSLEQYNTWWVHHGDDHRKFNPAQLGYHQLHIDPAFNSVAARAAGVGTMDQCIIDIMYLGSLDDAFPKPGGRSAEEDRDLSADIAAHVSFASVSGSFFKDV